MSDSTLKNTIYFRDEQKMRRSFPILRIRMAVIIVYPTTVTFTACSPFEPLPTSNSTC